MPDHFKYLSSFIFPVSVIWFLYTGPHTTINALLWTLPLWIIIVIDWLSPKIDFGSQKSCVSGCFYDAILYLLVFCQFAIIGLMINYASLLQWQSWNEVFISIMNLTVLRILVGTTSGSSAIIVAHELIHRSQLHLRVLGRLLLYTVCYEHFIISHMKAHHPDVATPDDMATARLGENFENYWSRVFTGQFKYAWESEVKRIKGDSFPFYHLKWLKNTVLQGVIVELTLVVLIFIYFGWAAAFIFLYQALSGVRLLETINYYQHWGLSHGKANNSIAWVNQSVFSEYALVGLSNHISHHKNSASHFYQNDCSEKGPKMPYGYFVTNLWVKLNNESYRKVSTRLLKENADILL